MEQEIMRAPDLSKDVIMKRMHRVCCFLLLSEPQAETSILRKGSEAKMK